jgi:hypothetical protein
VIDSFSHDELLLVRARVVPTLTCTVIELSWRTLVNLRLIPPFTTELTGRDRFGTSPGSFRAAAP